MDPLEGKYNLYFSERNETTTKIVKWLISFEADKVIVWDIKLNKKFPGSQITHSRNGTKYIVVAFNDSHFMRLMLYGVDSQKDEILTGILQSTINGSLLFSMVVLQKILVDEIVDKEKEVLEIAEEKIEERKEIESAIKYFLTDRTLITPKRIIKQILEEDKGDEKIEDNKNEKEKFEETVLKEFKILKESEDKGDKKIGDNKNKKGKFEETVLEEFKILKESIEAIKKDSISLRKEFRIDSQLVPIIKRIKKDCENKRMAFIAMPFTEKPIYTTIAKTIKKTLSDYNIVGLRADDKQYSDDLFENVLAYIHASDFGIAVFERVQNNYFNPNVSLEVGLYFGLKKNVCLLKDSSLSGLQGDLVGKLYKEFDVYDIENSITKQLTKWLKDKDMIN